MFRQVGLEGPELIPIAAASLAEWQRARDAGRHDAYDSRFGFTTELPVAGLHPGPADLSAAEAYWHHRDMTSHLPRPVDTAQLLNLAQEAAMHGFGARP